MRFFSVLVLFISISLHTNAQPNIRGRITGKVLNSATQKPVEYATITVTDAALGKIANGAVANAKGMFDITSLPAGQYKVMVEFIGYGKKMFDSVIISSTKPVTDLGVIMLTIADNALNDVVVTGKAPVVENKIDRVVYNVANDITSQGALAIDVLKKVPQVTVDIDGNVELQGNASIRFLINGKPSSMFGSSLADALASIPASQIKSIEAITSPGAKYDAQGTGGIINIILKDNKMQGINGNINVSAGTRFENGAVNLNMRHNNFGMNVFFSGNDQLRSATPTTQDRTSQDTFAKTATHLLYNSNADFKRNGYETGIGFDWNLSKNDNVNGSVSYDHFGNQGSGFTSQQQFTYNAMNTLLQSVYSIRQSDSRSYSNSVDVNLAYKKKFKKEDQELEMQYNASFGKPFSSYIQSQTYTGQPTPYTGTSSNNPGKDRETEIAVDYVHPVSENFIIETGAKATFNTINSVAGVNAYNKLANTYLPDPTQSYQLTYQQQVYAAYLSATFSLFDFLDIKSGVRYEYTNIKIDYANTKIPSYGTFVPSIIFSHQFEKGQTLKLAYSHRIERPEYQELNPFQNLRDPYNISTGNPLLQPEIGNNFELGYSKSFERGGNIYAALVERINSHDIKPYTSFFPTYKIGDSLYRNVSVSNRQNIGTEYNTGAMVNGSVPVTKKINVRGNLMVFNRRVVNNLNNGNVTNGLNWRFNLNTSFQLPKNLVAEAFGDYRSGFNNIQGKQPQSITYTFAFRKQCWNKNASVGFTATNPFNKYINQVTTITATNYSSYLLRQVPYRSFGISLTYKFGKLTFEKDKEGDNYLNNPPSL